MRTLARRLASVAVVLSLLSGLSLPLRVTSEPYDADAGHGAFVVPEHINQHFEESVSNRAEHCVLCHWWQAMSNARPAPAILIAPPTAAPGPVAGVVNSRVDAETAGHPSPRGPPSVA
jgi:hypothetical protein